MKNKLQFMSEQLIHKQEFVFSAVKQQNKFVFTVSYDAIMENAICFALKITNPIFISMLFGDQ